MSLNWKELEKQLFELKPMLKGAILQKISQTEEIASSEAISLALYSKEMGGFRLFSAVHNNEAFLGILPSDCKIDAAPSSTSAFIMLLRKYAIGCKIADIHQLKQDRVVVLELSNHKFLLFELIPRRSNILFLDSWDDRTQSGKCLASLKKVSLAAGASYQIPMSKAFDPKEIREFNEMEGDSYHERIFRFFWEKLNSDNFSKQRQSVLQGIKNNLKKILQAIENTQKDYEATELIDSLKKQAHLLFSNLYELGSKAMPKANKIVLECHESNKKIEIKLDPQKSYSENSDSLFKKIKKLERAKEEIQARLADLQKKKKHFEKQIQLVEDAKDATILERILPSHSLPRAKKKKESTAAEAKPFLEVESSDGFRILCGRNQIENRTVTFKESIGNDIWMHVKGIAGAHVVIKMQKNKTVPLNTLLEASQLALYYSKIRNGKKADIDYTSRKNVKPIKGTLAEVSYTDNKTLYVEADGEKLKKILRAG